MEGGNRWPLRRRVLALIIAAVVVSIGAAATAAPLTAAPATMPNPEAVIPRGEITMAPPQVGRGVEAVRYGIEPIAVYNVSLSDDTWSMNFYMWWRWRGAIDPVTTTSFDNANATSDNMKVAYSYTDSAGHEAPTTLPDGEHYQLAYFQVAFADDFPLGNYPLDKQNLTVRIENTTYSAHQLQYVPDPDASRNRQLVIPDWNTTGLRYATYLKTYDTHFGMPAAAAGYDTWSLATFTIQVARPMSHFFIKLLLPLIVVLIAAISCLLIKADHEISRLGIAATALLTLIFLQDAYSQELPANAGLVLLDKLYAAAYVCVIAVFARVIWETHQVFRHHRPGDSFIARDRVFAAGLGTVFLALTATLVIAAL